MVTTFLLCISVGSARAATRPAWFGSVSYNATTAGSVALKFARCPAPAAPGGKFCAHNGALNLMAAEALTSLKAGTAAAKGPCSAKLVALQRSSSRAEGLARAFYNGASSAPRAPVITASSRALLAWSDVVRCLRR